MLFTDDESKGSPTPEALRALSRKTHQTLKRVTRNFEQFEFNTIISSLMEMMNEMYRARDNGAVGSAEWREAKEIYLKMLAPVAPHISEELWADLGNKTSIHTQLWPQVNEDAARDDEITLPIQINGKIKERLTVPAGTSEEEIKRLVLANPTIQSILEGNTPKKLIVVPGKMISIVL
jgi:leucyl-tRNA synthetase